jgi:hypothetical protein
MSKLLVLTTGVLGFVLREVFLVRASGCIRGIGLRNLLRGSLVIGRLLYNSSCSFFLCVRCPLLVHYVLGYIVRCPSVAPVSAARYVLRCKEKCVRWWVRNGNGRGWYRGGQEACRVREGPGIKGTKDMKEGGWVPNKEGRKVGRILWKKGRMGTKEGR